MNRVRKSFGMSLIELLIAIAIVAVLSGGAYLNYADHVREAKLVVAKTTLRKFGEALQCYNSDHITRYSTSDPSHLLGSYTSENPEDPWGSVFVVDYFFGRIISPGPDAILETLVPFHPWHDLVPTKPFADDIIFQYERSGKISYVRGTNVSVINADGSRVSIIVSGSRAAASASNGALVLYVNNGDVSLIEDLGEVSTERVLIPPNPPQIPGFSVETGVSNGGREISWAPDRMRYAYICYQGTASAVMIGATTDSVDPFIVCTASTGNIFTDAVFDGSGTKLFLTIDGDADLEDSIFVASAAERSTVTTFVSGLLPGNPKRQVACSANNKYVMYSDGTDSYLLNSSSREVLTSYPGATWPTFSPDSQKIAYVYNLYQICASHLTRFPEERIDLTDFSSSIAISSVDWD